MTKKKTAETAAKAATNPVPVITTVKVLNFAGEARLVEYRDPDTGEMNRKTVPAATIQDNKLVDAEVLKSGIPYGVQWERHIKGAAFDPVKFSVELRRAGVWTEDDFNRKTTAVMEAMQRTLNLCLDQVRAEYLNRED